MTAVNLFVRHSRNFVGTRCVRTRVKVGLKLKSLAKSYCLKFVKLVICSLKVFKYASIRLARISGIRCHGCYCRSISAKPTGIKKKRTSPDRLKIRRNCIKTSDFSISIYITMLQSYINAFTQS